MASGTPRAYTNAIVSVGNSSRAVIRFRCVKCAHELEIANNNTRHHGRFFASQARKKGWDTDGESANRVYCPDCRSSPAFRSRREAELSGVVMPAMDEPPVIDGYAEVVPDDDDWIANANANIQSLPKPKGESRKMKLIGDDETAAVRSRELTQEQRMTIRNLLDKYFDDKEGCYLPNEAGNPLSDQDIAQSAGVPWAEVTKIREAAYGKILVDPAIAALRAQMAELEKHTAEQLAEVERRMTAMRAALDGYARKQPRAS